MSQCSSALNLLCLLPVRNGAGTLMRYFDGIRSFCAGVIALDDGSTDETPALLRAEPLVKAVLSNPRRASYHGWNDAENRRRLLHKCRDFGPDWILWLDVDELVAPCDVQRMKEFIKNDARTDSAYGFEVLRAIGDEKHYDKSRLWVYRLFAYRKGYTLPIQTLHFEPVPAQIPRNRWKRTRLRLIHLAGLTAAMRRARYQKYMETDPHHRWQQSYSEILDPPGHLWEVRSLPRDLDLLID
jgi:glycosyltransferase involved in cell wall biosynthesis